MPFKKIRLIIFTIPFKVSFHILDVLWRVLFYILILFLNRPSPRKKIKKNKSITILPQI